MKLDWQICAILEPSRLLDIIAQFLEGSAQPAAKPSLEKQPVRGMQQGLVDKLPFWKKIIEACVLDEARHAAVKGWLGGSKMKLMQNIGGWLYSLKLFDICHVCSCILYRLLISLVGT